MSAVSFYLLMLFVKKSGMVGKTRSSYSEYLKVTIAIKDLPLNIILLRDYNMEGK